MDKYNFLKALSDYLEGESDKPRISVKIILDAQKKAFLPIACLQKAKDEPQSPP